MSTALLTDRAVIQLYPLHIGEEQEGMHEVGRPETGEFINLPAEGVAIITWLQDGLTLGEVKDRFTDRYGQAPDLDDFLDNLTSCGFVQSVNGEEVLQDQEEINAPAPVTSGGLHLFAHLPSERLGWLRSIPLQALYIAIWLATPLLFIMYPMLPGAQYALVFPSVIANIVILTLFGYGLVFLHECAHMFAARAYGCDSTLTISKRLYFPIVQTDMTSVHTLPHNQRYGPYLAGITWDMGALLICTMLRALNLGGPWPIAITFLLLSILIFQCAFFMRTDIYFVISDWLRSENLIQDTQHWIANSVRHALRRDECYDLSAISADEMRHVRRYASLYMLGILVALAELLFIALPLLYQFTHQALVGLQAGPRQLAFWDGLAFFLLVALNVLLLLYVAWRDRRAYTE